MINSENDMLQLKLRYTQKKEKIYSGPYWKKHMMKELDQAG